MQQILGKRSYTVSESECVSLGEPRGHETLLPQSASKKQRIDERANTSNLRDQESLIHQLMEQVTQLQAQVKSLESDKKKLEADKDELRTDKKTLQRENQ